MSISVIWLLGLFRLLMRIIIRDTDYLVFMYYRICHVVLIIQKHQEIPQLHTAHPPTHREGHRTLTVTRHQEDNRVKQPALSFPHQDDCKTTQDTKHCLQSKDQKHNHHKQW